MKSKHILASTICGALFLLWACGGSGNSTNSGDSAKNKSTFKMVDYVGSDLGDINEELVAEGEAIYKLKCTACHSFDTRLVGPPLAGITEKRSPNWLMNIMLHNEEMVTNDPEAKAVFEEYNKSLMLVDGFEEEDARKVLEYLRKVDAQ